MTHRVLPHAGRRVALAAATVLALTAGAATAPAATLTIACGAVGLEYRLCREGARAWARGAGHEVRLIQSPSQSNNRLAMFQQMLASRSADVDVFQIDVIWPGILGPHLLDLRPHFGAGALAAHFDVLIDNNTVGGELKAIPWFADVGVLYYRKDLLAKHGEPVPETWAALEAAARRIVAAERAAGHDRLTGFVFQAKAYEGLTCNALEWIHSHGGGRILAADGGVTVHNARAVAALERAAGWIGGIAGEGVLTYSEEDARGVFQTGHAVFMRNWPYAYTLAQGADSPVRGKVGLAPLPAGGPDGRHSGTLGGWGLAVSRYSAHPALAADLVRHLTSAAEQARRAVAGGFNPTRPAVYEDPAVRAANPYMDTLADLMRTAVARPSAVAGVHYNRVSSIFWNAVHDALAGDADPEAALARAGRRLNRLRRGGRW